MTQGEIGNHLVVVPPSLSLPEHVTRVDELREDPVGGAFGDSYGGGDVSQADPRVVSHAHEDVGVVGQEVPAGGLRCQRWLWVSRTGIHELNGKLMLHLFQGGQRWPQPSPLHRRRYLPPAR